MRSSASMAAAVSSQRAPQFEQGLDGVYWRRYGAGPHAVIALHGWSGDHRSFEPLVDLLPADVSLYSFDQPGFGRSAPPAEWSIDQLTQPIVDVIDRIGLDRVTVLGSCSGAVVGMELAMIMGPRVDRLIMLDPFMTAPWFFRLFCWGQVGRFFYHCTFANPVGRWVTNRALADRRTDDTNLTEHFETADHGRALGYLNALCDSGLHDRGYERLDAIGEFVVGDRTFESVKKSVAWWREIRWPSAPLTTLPEAGHMPVHEDPEGVAKAIFGTPSEK